jgi:hypothetical protein
MSQPYRTESAMRSRPSSAMRRLLAALMLFLGAERGDGVDLTPWARHMRHHRDWTSVDFRDPVSGLFLAARAGTEDEQRNATLTLTAAPAQGCVADFVIVLKTDTPASRDSDEFARIAVRIDALATQSLEARIVRQGGDSFIFVQILDEFRLDTLKDRKTMTVVMPDAQVANFSLEGFDSAWSTAQATCRSFAAP